MMTKMSQVADGCDTNASAQGAARQTCRGGFSVPTMRCVYYRHMRSDGVILPWSAVTAISVFLPLKNSTGRAFTLLINSGSQTHRSQSLLTGERMSSQAWFTCSQIGSESLCRVFLSFFKLELLARSLVLNHRKYFQFDKLNTICQPFSRWVILIVFRLVLNRFVVFFFHLLSWNWFRYFKL